MSEMKIPASIVSAICAVKSTLEAVEKSQKNEHGGWKYSSTDDIYAAITKKMGEVGLIILSLEEGSEIAVSGEGKDARRWLKATYQFVLATPEDTWTHDKCRRTVMVLITGPQTHQGAQSFAEKSFLRSLFKIPTGDVDLDAMPENFSYNPIFKKATVPPPPPPQPQPQPADDGTDEVIWDDPA